MRELLLGFRVNRFVAAVLLLGPLLAGCVNTNPNALANLTPGQEYLVSVSAVNEILEPYGKMVEMTTFAGVHPTRCVTVSDRSAICVWPIPKTARGWEPLAKALDASDSLNLVCEFPVDESPRGPGSCGVHPRRSNRTYWAGAYRDRERTGEQGSAIRRAHRRDAQRLLDQATTAFQLSTVVGDAPESCHVAGTVSLCTWATNNSTYGHGTLARIVDVQSKKVRLNCSLPPNGQRRAVGDCSAVISD